MLNSSSLAAVVIGEGTLPIRCAEHLLKRGWTVEVMVSTDSAVSNWAKEQGLQSFSAHNTAQVTDCLKALKFDCLFSVANCYLLSDEVIGFARHRAVNYHDSLLPRYAGLNAATWALIEGETHHGVTWHEMTMGLDEGDVLVQESVTVAEDETSLTLNVKCYEAAIASFSTLVEQLEQGTATAQPQDLSQRTYFAGWARPWAGGLLDFHQDADRLSQLVRGLSFRSGSLNELTLAKLLLGDSAGGLLDDRWVVVEQLSVRSQHSDATPGTVIALDESEVVIATATADVALSAFQSQSGETLTMEALDLAVGQVLPQLAAPQTMQHLSEAVARHEGFWRQRLQASESLKITWMENPSGEIETSQAQANGTQAWALPDDLHQGLTTLARPHCDGQTAFALAMTTALGAYLSRVSDEGYGDLAFSGPQQQQIAQQASASLGHGTEVFSPVVPMQMRLNLEQPMAAALAAVAQEQAQVAKHGSYAQDLWLRDPGLETLPQWPVAVTWQGEAGGETSPAAKGQLLNLVIVGEQCHWEYDARRLSAAAVSRFAGQLESFMAGIIAQPERSLSHQPLLTTAEEQQVLRDWNQTQADYDWHCCVHNLFEAQAAQHPDRIALQFKQSQLTYAELNQRANQIAHALLQRGVKANDRVGIHVDRSLEMIIALLGVLKAGAAYLPLDPSYPRDRLALMVEDAAPTVLLTQRAFLGNLTHDCELCLDNETLWSEQPISNPGIEVRPEHLAYIIYTSGSTGRPKGVMIEHGSLTNLSKAVTCDYHIGEDVVLEFASISFDMAVEEIYPCLISGGHLVVRTSEMIQSVKGFLEECSTLGITVLSLPTAYWHLIVAELNADHSLRMPEAIRVVLIGGEAANPRRVMQWQQMCHRTGFRTSLLNTYGPTEGTVDSTFYQFELPSPEALEAPVAASVPIGYPISNVTNYVLDRYQQPVPVGCVGELCVGGAGVARGYLHRPDLTAERFIPDPFSSEPGARLYRTGDLVRHRPDGAIDYLGRLDHQVKIRGFRIELGEIEALLMQQATVEDAVVIAREDQPGQKRLVAYVVAKDWAILVPEQLREALSEKLPDYMVPVAFVALDSLPMTPNEKVDRKALPQPELSNLAMDCQANRFIAPITVTEQALAKIWEKLLGITPIGRTANFLELGGDSLSAMRLCMQIEREFDQKLMLSTLFQTPRLADLAKIIQGEAAVTQSCVLPLKSEGSRPPLFFVNCAQDANQIANYLGDEYRVYGLNLFGATDRLFDQLEQFEMRSMAKVFVDDIRKVQPEGPYYLSSYCGDTRLTIELAHEFERQGEEVALLALIDPWWNPDPPTLAYHWQTLLHFGLGYAIDKLTEKARLLTGRLAVMRDQWSTKLRQFSNQAPSEVDRDVELYHAYKAASDAFKPEPYPGYTVVMFSEELQIDKTGELDDVLAHLAVYGYEKLSVPGYHHALFYPESMEILGEHLRWAIENAEARSKRASMRTS